MFSEEQKIDTIISGCKAGNRKAQEQLYRSFYKAMMNLCLRYTKNETDAMEVLNTGFYKVFKNIQRFDSLQGSLYTWIRTIIVNSCLDFIKKKEKKFVTHELTSETEAYITPEAIQKFNASELLNLIRQLPPATQTVFNLYVIDGYNHREIAELLGISEGTSKWHVSEARKTMQQLITDGKG